MQSDFPSSSSQLALTLTLCADDPGSLPAPVGPAAGSGDVTLEEAFRALVADHCMNVIVWPPPTYQMGVLHCRRGPTQHCTGNNTIKPSDKSYIWRLAYIQYLFHSISISGAKRPNLWPLHDEILGIIMSASFYYVSVGYKYNNRQQKRPILASLLSILLDFDQIQFPRHNTAGVFCL